MFWDANRINGELYLSDNFYGKKTIRRIVRIRTQNSLKSIYLCVLTGILLSLLKSWYFGDLKSADFCAIFVIYFVLVLGQKMSGN